MPKVTLKYEIGYKFYNYEIVGIARHKYNGKTCTNYIVKCLKCGTEVERRSCDIGKDIKCSGCKKNMEYYRFNVGDVVNGLEIIEKQKKIRSNGVPQRAYLCKCVIDSYTSVHTEDNLLKGKGCAVCAGIVIMRGINDINTVAPWLGELLENKDDGYKYGVYSHKKLKFKCPYCGTLTKPMKIYNVYIAKHITCRKCGDGVSMPEKIMYGLLEQLKINFEYQKQFDWSCGKFYDFYIKDISMIIETHGLQHYRDDLNGNWGNPEEIKQNDEFKKNNAINNCIKNYLEIDCSNPSPLNLINIYKNTLSVYWDLNDIDFDKIVLESSKSFCIKAGDLWNSGNHDVSSIAEILRLNVQTIRKYLKTLTKIGYLNINYPIKKIIK